MANGNGKNHVPPKKEEPKKLSPNEIVRSAYAYLQNIITAQSQKIAEVRIEELTPFENGTDFWNVVLSYDVLGEFAFDKKREYKQFKINAFNGNVEYMKIFNPRG